MNDAEYQSIIEKLDEVTLKNKEIRRDNLNKNKTIRHLKRVIKSLKKDAQKERKKQSSKQHYKNG